MSTAVLPTLTGLGFDVQRTPLWSTIVQQNLSSHEFRLGLVTYPRYQWDLTFNFLRSAAAFSEFQTLLGFYNLRQGSLDSFLYMDSDDNAVTSQQISVGDGSTKTFQLVKSFGGSIEPVLAPHTVSHIYLNGVNQASGWSVSNWGSASPGVLTFTSAPASGVVITADFSYYYPCRFVDDKTLFSNFAKGLWTNKQISFISLKN